MRLQIKIQNLIIKKLKFQNPNFNRKNKQKSHKYKRVLVNIDPMYQTIQILNLWIKTKLNNNNFNKNNSPKIRLNLAKRDQKYSSRA